MPKVVQLLSCIEKPLKKQKSLKWAFICAFSRMQVYTRSYVILCHSDILGHSEDFSLSAPTTALDAARYLYVSAVSYRYAEVESWKNWSQETPSQYIMWYHVILSSIISQIAFQCGGETLRWLWFLFLFSGLYQIKTDCGPMSTLASYIYILYVWRILLQHEDAHRQSNISATTLSWGPLR